MCDNELINKIFSDFQKNLDQEQELRETIRTICKEVDQISREATTVLQVIHYNEAGIAPACGKARLLFEKAHDGYARLKDAVPPTDYFKYQDHWRFMTQRYCYLIALTIWLEKGILASHETMAEILGVSPVELKEGFHLDIEDYLIGLLTMCSELSRLAVNSVTRGDYERPLRISKFVMELNAGFRLLNLKNDHLRKRFDALKYDVKKIEEVVYDLSIRGLLPKGDADHGPEHEHK
ncbi:translin [Bombyx mandarina]|uniref:Translin n=2 Tax=Bombyx TaxID=7090 RepID=Q2F5K2_BOMMO|nr:translin [Bombyx mori]XP_028028752.1 translin [Bombyx mandarina]ABD36365.1 translin [Bombyx mori]